MLKNSTFRFDINALRALAVISVLLFHFESSALPGGFIGVDIFFVVSGYLMTSIILRELFNQDTVGGGFSIWCFYKMRARRIIPALITVCFFCLIWGFCNFDNNDYARLGRHIRDSLLFTSNYTYLRGVNDYFSADPSKFVLLHTWSLSVEWQFYIIYPIILILIKKFFYTLNCIKSVIAFLFILSLISSLIIGHYNPQADYFLLYGRAYEMLTGAFAFLYQDQAARRTDCQKSVIAGLGFILIACSILLLNQNFVWPSAWALLPACGTLLILLANQQYAVYRFWPIQILGKISYSLYLVHWPILSISNIHQIKLNIAELSILSLIVASILYITIERKRIYKYKCIAMYILCFILAIMVRYDLYNIYSLKAYSPWDSNANLHGANPSAIQYLDHSIKATEDFSVVLYGDSYAKQYIPLLNAYGININDVTLDGCLSTNSLYAKWDDKCIYQYNKFIKQIKKTNAKIIVWAQNWTEYNNLIKRLNSQPISYQLYLNKVTKEIQTVINQLNDNQKLVVIGQYHRPSINVLNCLNTQANRLYFLQYTKCRDYEDQNLNELNKKVTEFNEILNGIFKRNKTKITIFYPDDVLCKQHICKLIENHMPLYSVKISQAIEL